jgi:transcriptional regulator with XRE-family HTH domain
MNEEELFGLGIGERLRRLREDRGLSGAELARRSGIPEERIAAIEASRAVPGVGELVRLGGPLHVSVGAFFQRAISERRIELVRAGERWAVPPQSEAARTLNYRYQSLSHRLTDKLMSPFLVEVPPDPGVEAEASRHDGEEFLFVLSGELEVRVGGETHRLSPGDSIYFDSRLEHALRAVEGTSARILACIAERPHPDAESPIRRAYA